MLNAIQHSPAPGARALYLGSKEPKHIAATSEALVVTNTQRQVQRFPVIRIARIVSNRLVNWSGEALMLCMDRGIPITWLTPQGQAIGSAHPLRRAHLDSGTALELMVETNAGLQTYRHWLNGRRLSVLISWAQQRACELTPQEWEQAKQQWVYSATITEHLPAALKAHCLAWTEAQLYRHSLQAQYFTEDGNSIDLDQDLNQLLWGDMNLNTGNLTDTLDTAREQTDFFERWIARNGSTLLLHLQSLYRTARRALAP